MSQSDPAFFLPLTRRDVFLALGAGALSLVLPGCGGGGRGGGSGAAKPVTVAGTVEPGSLAASSGLTVTNVYQASAPVGAAGEFSTLASSSGTMVHFVTDASGSLVGATVSMPGQAITFNAESCLLASLFLTPGIVVIGASEATAAVVQLRSQASYAAALAYLKTNLPTTTYQAILSDAAYPDLLMKCVLDYQSAETKARGVQVNPPPAVYRTADQFNIDLNIGKLSATQVTLVNAGWRYVRIDRLERNVEGSVIANSVPAGVFGLNFLGGAMAFSAGSVLTQTAGQATEAKDAHALDLSAVPTTEYWIQGPGWQTGEALPKDRKADGSFYVPDDKYFVLLLSLFQYVFLPLAGALLGKKFEPKSDVSLWINTLYRIYSGAQNSLAVIGTVVDPSTGFIAQDVAIIAQGIFNALRDVLVALFEDEILKDVVSEDIKEEVAEALGKIFVAFKFVFVAANAGALVKAWIGYRPSFQMLITSSAAGGVTVQ